MHISDIRIENQNICQLDLDIWRYYLIWIWISLDRYRQNMQFQILDMDYLVNSTLPVVFTFKTK